MDNKKHDTKELMDDEGYPLSPFAGILFVRTDSRDHLAFATRTVCKYLAGTLEEQEVNHSLDINYQTGSNHV